jgi:hypothetical protein
MAAEAVALLKAKTMAKHPYAPGDISMPAEHREIGTASRMEASESERRAAAIHEAGHAVVMWALGSRVDAMTVEDGGKGCIHACGGSTLSIAQEIAIAAAGAAAVELLKSEKWPFASFTDDMKIVELLEGYLEEDANLLRVEGEKLAIDILAANVGLLTALADALNQSGRLAGKELTAFLRQCRL